MTIWEGGFGFSGFFSTRIFSFLSVNQKTRDFKPYIFKVAKTSQSALSSSIYASIGWNRFKKILRLSYTDK